MIPAIPDKVKQRVAEFLTPREALDGTRVLCRDQTQSPVCVREVTFPVTRLDQAVQFARNTPVLERVVLSANERDLPINVDALKEFVHVALTVEVVVVNENLTPFFEKVRATGVTDVSFIPIVTAERSNQFDIRGTFGRVDELVFKRNLVHQDDTSLSDVADLRPTQLFVSGFGETPDVARAVKETVTSLDFLTTNVRELCLSYLPGLTDVSALRHCTALEMLSLDEVLFVRGLGVLGDCPRLRKLQISCYSATSFDELLSQVYYGSEEIDSDVIWSEICAAVTSARALTQLHLGDVPMRGPLPVLPTTLHEVVIVPFGGFESLDTLTQCAQLRKVRVELSANVRLPASCHAADITLLEDDNVEYDLSTVIPTGLNELTKLCINCEQEIAGDLAGAPHLEQLDISVHLKGSGQRTVPFLQSGSPALRKMRLGLHNDIFDGAWPDLTAMINFPALEYLHISVNFRWPRNALDTLAQLPALTHLRVDGNGADDMIPVCPGLRVLDVSSKYWEPRNEHMSVTTAQLVNLEELHISTDSVTTVRAPNLRTLGIRVKGDVENLQLEHLTKLETLVITGPRTVRLRRKFPNLTISVKIE